ncbi:AraC family transcriptional regulator [Chryseobacterium sp. LC2016-27]|uniref:helix-turn-helix domain-containing protein n=1 Tax=Chryseobacterium sp. LC2016-27 TaxID=2897326 RepID=UPI001E336752|nr:AraC family transcriptional regulator [Chryseobacterium sp. LC2016-27]MCD0457533.1 AraC family transcriptional regulator [Chryseobacterium sp. LC2016-27]
MNTKFYLLFILFSFKALWAQSVEPAGNTPETKAIDKKLQEIHIQTKTFIDPKFEKTLLQLKNQSKELGYEDGVLRSGDYLMGLYVGVENDKKAAELATELKKVAQNKKDTYGHISSIYRRSGLTLGYLGLSDESLKDFHQAIKYAEQVENSDKKRRLLAFAYNNMNVYYLNKKKEPNAVDSMYSNFKKSLAMAKMISDNDNVVSIQEKYDLIADLNMQIAALYLTHNKGNDHLKLAEKHLFEILNIYSNTKFKGDPVNKARVFNELSRLYIQKKEPQKAIEYGKQALEFEKLHSGPFVRLQSYKTLLEAYLEIEDTDSSKFYREKFNTLNDSMNYEATKTANYTMKKMVAEVDTKHEEKSTKQLIAGGAFILIAALAGIFLWRRNNKKLHKSYELMIDKLKKESVPQKIEINSTNRNVISSETEKRIFDQLEIFENSEEFLKPNLTISLLSTHLSTNAKYLSEIIKNQKSHSFSSYINHLRINYIVHKLYNEPKYRDYKTSHLAEICGYASPQVFFAAFKKINQVTPVYFIEKLNEDKM